MHYSALLDIEVALRRHVLADPRRTDGRGLSLLDVRGTGDDGSVRDMSERFGLRVTSVAPDGGNGVDHTVATGHPLPFADGEYDVVMCVGALARDPRFLATFAEMNRVCASDGIVIVLVPSGGDAGRLPVDCWRFLPDSMPALAESVGVHLVDSWRNECGPFHNVVGIFRRSRPEGSASILSTPSLNDLGLIPTMQNAYPAHEFPEREMTKGVEKYRRLLASMHTSLNPGFYLEIGVESGRTLAAATGRAVGIDPAPVLQIELPSNCELALETSDDYFNARRHDGSIPPIDYAFIDGLHVFENVLMDFMNVERHASPTSVIVVDDVLPNHPVQAYRLRETQHWTGDVWKIVPTLRAQRPDLLLLLIDTAPTGLLFVIGADSSNRTLWDSFDQVIDHALDEIGDPPEEFIHRHDAIDPNDPLLDRIFGHLRRARERGEAPDISHLRALVEGARPRVVAGYA